MISAQITFWQERWRHLIQHSKSSSYTIWKYKDASNIPQLQILTAYKRAVKTNFCFFWNILWVSRSAPQYLSSTIFCFACVVLQAFCCISTHSCEHCPLRVKRNETTRRTKLSCILFVKNFEFTAIITDFVAQSKSAMTCSISSEICKKFDHQETSCRTKRFS